MRIPAILEVKTGNLPYWSEDTDHALVFSGAEGGDVRDTAIVNDPAFPNAMSVHLGDVLLAWDEHDIVLLLTIAQAIKARSAAKSAIPLPAGADKVRELGKTNQEKIIDHLVVDAIYSITSPPQKHSLYPTAKEILTLLAGNWVGEQLRLCSKTTCPFSR